MKKVTMKDIAEKLGVSISTVSRALSNSPGVSEELKERVRKTAEEMGYFPNLLARSLKKSESKTVGLIVPDISNPFFVEFLEGVDKVFFSKEYKFIVGNTDEDLDREKTYLEWFISHGVDGIIAAPTAERSKSNERIFRKIVKMGIPLVLFDRFLESLEGRVDAICVDNELAIREALVYLKGMGHESVGIMLGKIGIYTMKKRKEAFLRGVEELGMKTKKSWILEDLFPENEAVERIENFLKSGDVPTALVISNQSLTRSFLRASKSVGITVGEDISTVSFDDAVENEFYSPPLTSIRQPAKEMGKMAATFLLSRIEGDRSRPSKVVLRTELIVRESVKKINPSSP